MKGELLFKIGKKYTTVNDTSVNDFLEGRFSPKELVAAHFKVTGKMPESLPESWYHLRKTVKKIGGKPFQKQKTAITIINELKKGKNQAGTK